MVHTVQPSQQRALESHRRKADQQRHQQQGCPVRDAQPRKQYPGAECSQRKLRAVSEIDDAQHSEDDCQSQAHQRIEGAIDEP
ncbi:hypothetical protein D3C72_2080810 [compost metagenome]